MKAPSADCAAIAAEMKHRALSADSAGKAIGKCAAAARIHLWRLVKAGIAGFREVRNTGGGSEKVTVFYLLPTKPCADFNRPEPKQYPLNHVRDPLTAALFGPAQQQGQK